MIAETRRKPKERKKAMYRCECGALYRTIGTVFFCKYGAFEFFYGPAAVTPAIIFLVDPGSGPCDKCAIFAAQHTVINGLKKNNVFYSMHKKGVIAASSDGRIVKLKDYGEVHISDTDWTVNGSPVKPITTNHVDINLMSGGYYEHPSDWGRLGLGGKFACALLYEQTGKAYADLELIHKLLIVQSKDKRQAKNALVSLGLNVALWVRPLTAMLVMEYKTDCRTAVDMR